MKRANSNIKYWVTWAMLLGGSVAVCSHAYSDVSDGRDGWGAMQRLPSASSGVAITDPGCWRRGFASSAGKSAVSHSDPNTEQWCQCPAARANTMRPVVIGWRSRSPVMVVGKNWIVIYPGNYSTAVFPWWDGIVCVTSGNCVPLSSWVTILAASLPTISGVGVPTKSS